MNSAEQVETDSLSFADLLVPDGVFLGLPASSAEGVIREMGGRLHSLGYVLDGFVEATLAREASMPTGLQLGGEFNAAIPHVDIEYVDSPALALATLSQDVLFQNMGAPEESVPVRLVIMMALDRPKAQVEMLQQIATLLQSPELVKRIVEADTVSNVFDVIKEAQP
jgi:PTS system galactitol-specific IIA component